ncbi:hypothetical protein MTO96_014924 [Rhipicephalus appendiculatus]
MRLPASGGRQDVSAMMCCKVVAKTRINRYKQNTARKFRQSTRVAACREPFLALQRRPGHNLAPRSSLCFGQVTAKLVGSTAAALLCCSALGMRPLTEADERSYCEATAGLVFGASPFHAPGRFQMRPHSDPGSSSRLLTAVVDGFTGPLRLGLPKKRQAWYLL